MTFYAVNLLHRMCITLLLRLVRITFWRILEATLHKCFHAGEAWAGPAHFHQDGPLHHAGLNTNLYGFLSQVWPQHIWKQGGKKKHIAVHMSNPNLMWAAVLAQ